MVPVFRRNLVHVHKCFRIQTRSAATRLGALERVRPSSSCLPAKINLCWSGGMPSGCCNQREFGHLQVVCQQRSTSVGLGECLLDVVIRESSAIFKLFASKDQPLLVWGNAF